MNNDVIEVVMAMDDNYVTPAVVSVLSLARAASSPVRLHVIYEGPEPKRRDELVATLKPFMEVALYAPTKPLSLDLSPAYNDYLSSASMNRLQMADLLPPEIERALYIDADLLVLEDPQPLWSADLAGNAVAAVHDPGWPSRRTFVTADGRAEERTTGARPPGYFNSGVMIVDLPRWREEKVYDRCRRLHEQVGNELRAPDQDILNMVFEAAWTQVPSRWNELILRLEDPAVHLEAEEKWANFLAGQEPGPRRDAWAEYISRRQGIIHYSGRRKPWQAEFPAGPLKDLWAEHAEAARLAVE